MDFVSAWKASSIGITGAFGILGLLKEFKTKDGRITRWGYVSLGGILISSVLGIAAQLIQSSNDAAKALEMATRSDLLLNDIQRQLNPIGTPKFHMTFFVQCSEVRTFCKELTKQSRESKYPYGEVPAGLWIGWPGQATIAGDLVIRRGDDASIDYSFSTARARGDSSLDAMPGSTDAKIYLHTVAEITANKGMKSVLDFQGASVTLELKPSAVHLTVGSFTFETSDGELHSLQLENVPHQPDVYTSRWN
jgi:hypothetical protein